MDAITSSPLFGLTLTLLIFIVGVRINENIRKPWTNPLLFATLVIILIL
ncbi:MAG: LrgB family protein, partial [Lactococcus garvieae]